MSGKLNQSLDEIVSTSRRQSSRRGGRATRRSIGRPTTTAPVGGVQKITRPPRGAAPKQAPAKAIGGNGESKVVVSNLPKDVNEGQIKEYFNSSVGHIKRVELSYGPNGVSRGIASVTFVKADGAQNAFTALNGLLVDNRPIKIEIVVSAAKAAEIIPPTKTLAERTSQPKSQPKSAAPNRKKETAVRGGGASGARGGRGGKKEARPRNGRPAKKTAEELDSEMADYFDSAANQNENTNGAAPATNGDAPMDDGIM
ncbi:mlo3-like protein [Pseudomassariella vexata]|uniref:Mlo3-like protein n=1 Tax=Pseudomassariella vexata TaxID=1141098 RepID=A0A1Y2DA32_9PEZI|nr:mlo3-like protein [Pseudomassariella vexata]ORY56057.1 mlo3-like protein [Pseudomassariella vexata]